MRRQASLLLLALALGPVAHAADDEEEKVDGYLEWRQGDFLIADGQKVRVSSATKFKGKGEAKDVASIPLGYELKAKGVRGDDGVAPRPGDRGQAERRRALRERRPQGHRRSRAAVDPGGTIPRRRRARATSVGRLYTEGPEVDRVRRIVDSLCPPYLDPGAFRVYVIDNKEWNAFAMGNYSIYVFTGLLQDLDDDEVAIVLGHEMVHATHEHTRRQFKKQMWIQLAALGLAGVEEASIDDKKARAVAELMTVFAAAAVGNGYGRGYEDQADRVGLRYAYEGGYDITKGPRLWNRFAKKYGESGKVAELLLRRPLALLGPRRQPGEADRLQLSRRARSRWHGRGPRSPPRPPRRA